MYLKLTIKGFRGWSQETKKNFMLFASEYRQIYLVLLTHLTLPHVVPLKLRRR